MTDSLAQGLACIECPETFPLTYRLQCASCGGLLEIYYDLDIMRQRGPALLAGRGLWRYAAVLPVVDPSHRITLGEGETPYLECPRLAADLGVRAPGRQVRGRQSDRQRERPHLGDRRRGRSRVRFRRGLRRQHRQRRLLGGGLRDARRAARLHLRLRTRLSPQAASHGRHRFRSHSLRRRLR